MKHGIFTIGKLIIRSIPRGDNPEKWLGVLDEKF